MPHYRDVPPHSVSSKVLGDSMPGIKIKDQVLRQRCSFSIYIAQETAKILGAEIQDQYVYLVLF